MPLPLQRVVVVGAGPAGLATALCLSKLGLQVTVLDENPAPAWTGVAVLDDVALRLLDLLDLGAQVRAQGVALGRAVLQQ
jgi:2-polyprenyl-6-methoxyphenol hydroxylase-like FAD-dependent oxidoreductase